MGAVRKLIHPDRFPIVRPDPLHGLRDRMAAGSGHHELPDGFPRGRLQDPVVDFAGHERLQHLSVLGVLKEPRESVKGVRERLRSPVHKPKLIRDPVGGGDRVTLRELRDDLGLKLQAD